MKKKAFLMCLLTIFIASCNKNPITPSNESSEEEISSGKISDYLTSEKINLINLKGESTFDLLKGDRYISLYLEDAKGPLSYSLISMISGEETLLSSNIVDFNNIEKAYYVAVIYQEIKNEKYPLYAYYVDFYDENDPFMWNEYNYKDDEYKIMIKGDAHDDDLVFNADSNDYYRATNANPQASYVEAGVGPNDQKGNYYHIHSDEAGYLGYAEGLLINFAPLHSSKYYRLFDDAEYMITYDLYITGEEGYDLDTGISVPREDIYCVFATISEKPNGASFEQPYNRSQFYGVNSFKRVTLPVKDYFSSNPHLENIKENYPNTVTGWKWMIDKESIWGSSYPNPSSISTMAKTDVYIGNFSIERTKYEIRELGLIDKKETASINLGEFKNATFELYKKNGSSLDLIKEFEENSLDLSELEGDYYIHVYQNNYLALKIYFDVYDSDGNIVWGSSPSGCIATLWGQYEDYETSTMSIEKVDNSSINLLKDKEGDYYSLSYTTTSFFRTLNFMPNPIHSMAYYEKYHDRLDEYGISFDLLIDDSNGELLWTNGSVKHDYNSSSEDYDFIVTNYYDSGTYPIKYTHAEFFSNRLYSYTLSLDALYQGWLIYNDAIVNTDNTNNVVASSSLVAIATNRLEEGKPIKYYVGGINSFKYDVETKLSYSNIVADTIPENVSYKDEDESVDLSQYLSTKNLSLFNKYKDQTTILLSLSQDGINKYNFQDSILNIKDNIDVGLYDVSLSINGYRLLQGNIYIYHYDEDLDGLDLSSDVSSEVNMVDVTKTNSFAIADLSGLSSGNVAAINEKPSFITYSLTNKHEETVNGSGTNIDLSTLHNVLYDIEVKIKSFKIYKGKIDLYDLTSISNDDWLNINNVNLYTDGSGLTISKETYIPHHDISGDYIKITNPGDNNIKESFVFTISPTHSKEYYEFDEVKQYFNNKELTFSVKGYVYDNGTYYSSDSNYYLKNILAARNDQPWLVGVDGANLSPGTVPIHAPDGTHGRLYFSNFLLMYDQYALGNNASYSLFGTTGAGMQLLYGNELIEGKEFSIFVGNYLVKER